jgi:hypothetical protein
LSFEPLGAPRVSFYRVVMRLAVDLDDEARRETNNIDDKATDRILATESQGDRALAWSCCQRRCSADVWFCRKKVTCGAAMIIVSGVERLPPPTPSCKGRG